MPTWWTALLHPAHFSSQENSMGGEKCMQELKKWTQFKYTGTAYIAWKMERQDQDQNCQLKMLTCQNRSSFSKISAIATKGFNASLSPPFSILHSWLTDSSKKIWQQQKWSCWTNGSNCTHNKRWLSLLPFLCSKTKFYYCHPWWLTNQASEQLLYTVTLAQSQN